MSVSAWDNHVCLPLDPRRSALWSELERHRAAGFSVASINIGCADRSWEQHLETASALTEWVNKHPDQYRIIKPGNPILPTPGDDRLAVFFDVEGANWLDGQVERIRLLRDIGVGWMSLGYNTSNALVGGCLPDAIDEGLTPLGKLVVEAMSECGMMVCCSHTGHRSARDIIAFSDHPVIFSHSNCQAVYDHWRNIPDALIRACSEKGGVIGLNGVGPFLGPDEASVERLLEHIDHVVQLVGAEHAALALDYVYDQDELDQAFKKNPSLFTGSDSRINPFTFLGPEYLPQIRAGMEIRGYDETAIEGILGGNIAKLAASIWH